MQQLNYQFQSNFLQSKFIFRQIEGVFIVPTKFHGFAKNLIQKPKARRIEVIDESEEHIIKKPLSAYLVSDEYRRSSMPELIKSESLGNQSYPRIPVYQYSRLTGGYSEPRNSNIKHDLSKGTLLSIALMTSAVTNAGNKIQSASQQVYDGIYGLISKLFRTKSKVNYMAVPDSGINWRQRIKGFLPAIVLSSVLFFVITFSQFRNNQPTGTPQSLGISENGQTDSTDSQADEETKDEPTNNDNAENNDDTVPELSPIPGSTQPEPSNQSAISSGSPALPVGGSGGGISTSPTPSAAYPVTENPTTHAPKPTETINETVEETTPSNGVTVPGQSVELLDTTLIETQDTTLTIQ